jgi:uncharacterized protein (TIGR00369 family)
MPRDKSETQPVMHTPSMPMNERAPDFPAGVLSTADIDRLLEVHFPQIHLGGRVFFIEGAGVKRARMRMAAHEKNLRPGNTLSGPSMFQLADVALYVAILATLGESALQAVTTNLNINFLSRPAPGDLIADVTLVKVGKRLVVGEVDMFSPRSDAMVAHAIATYAMPSRKAD